MAPLAGLEDAFVIEFELALAVETVARLNALFPGAGVENAVVALVLDALAEADRINAKDDRMAFERDYKAIYAASKAAGMDEDARRDCFERLTGKRSLSLMSDAEVARMDAYFRKLTPKKRPAASRADVRLIHVLWRRLGEAGVLTDPTRKGLDKFIRARFGAAWGAETIDVDALTDARQIATVIEALKDWCRRAGAELER